MSRFNAGLVSYNIKQTQHSDLRALLRSVHYLCPQIITMCQTLQHLVGGHGLTQEDDFVAVALKLGPLIKRAYVT
jgi:hypothetical protein